MKRRLSAELILIWIYLLSNITMFTMIIAKKNYLSEFKHLEFRETVIGMLSLFLLVILGYIFTYYFYLITKKKKISLSIKAKINIKRWDYIIGLILLFQIMFFLKTGIGKAGSNSNSSFSFIANIFDVSTIFPYYYFLCRRRKKIYTINICMYILFQIIKGWSGIIFVVFIYELKILLSKKSKSKLYILLIPLLLIIGGILYKYMYYLKNYIRFGFKLNINFSEAIIKLYERLSFISHLLVSFRNTGKITELYNTYGVKLLEIRGFFRPLLPRIIMPNKDFRGYNNLLMNSVYPDITNQTSSNSSIIGVCWNLYSMGIIEIISYLIFLIFLIFCFKLIIDLFKDLENSNLLEIHYFIFLLTVFQNGSLETIMYGWIKIIYILFLLYGFRALKFCKNKQKE